MATVVVTAEGDDLDSMVSMHFGRCPCFIVAETEGKKMKSHEAVKNPYFGKHEAFEVPSFVSGLKADVLITGGIGPRAIQAFQPTGIKIIHGFSGKSGEALESYLKGEIEEDLNPCDHA